MVLILSIRYLNELQLQILRHLVVFTHTKDVCDDVMGGIPLVPEGLEDLVGLIYPTLHAVSQHLLDQEGVWLVTHL